LSHRGDLGLAPPGWFGRGLLTRPSSAMAVSDRRRVTWRPTVSQTAGSGDPRRTKGRPAGSGDPRRTKRRRAGSGDPRRTKRRRAGSGDPRRTKQIRNESSRDQKAVKTNFAACHRSPAQR